MTEVVLSQENSSESRDASAAGCYAVVTPMLFVADRLRPDRQRPRASRAMRQPRKLRAHDGARGVRAEAGDAGGGRSARSVRARDRAGFPTQIIESEHAYEVRPVEGGFLEITTPLDSTR
jgi:hypothetical protein